MTTPVVGSVLRYYANATSATPQAAIVVNVPDGTHFDLFVLSAAGVGSAVLGVLFCDRSFKPSTAFCEAMWTNIRLTGGVSPSPSMMQQDLAGPAEEKEATTAPGKPKDKAA
jgi:hypothetical protein